jgi:hypothetical protein
VNKLRQKPDFSEIVQLIESARQRVNRMVNTELMFARTIFNPPKVSTMLRELHPKAGTFLKDSYFLAEYQTQLPDKKLLQAKLHEFYALNVTEGEES